MALATLCLIIALVLFVIAAILQPPAAPTWPRISLVPLGLAFVILAQLLGGRAL